MLQANIDAAGGRHQLFMDELITFDGAMRITKAQDAAAFAQAAAGPDQRYGRTVWYLSFLSAEIGETISGETGRIIAKRIAFALTMAAGVWLIVLSLIKGLELRLLAFLLALYLPYSSYYAGIPKPEPIIVLALGAFLYITIKRNAPLGLSWFWLGIAYGAKILMLPVTIVYAIYAAIRHYALGRAFIPVSAPLALGAALLGFLISVPIIILQGAQGWQRYIASTWNNRTHGADNAATGISEWLSFMEKSAFFGPEGFSTFIALCLFFFAAFPFLATTARQWPLFEKNALVPKIKTLALSREFALLTVAGTGLGLLVAIFISVDRLWGFYLYPGALLLTIAGIGGIECCLGLARPFRKLFYVIVAIAMGGGATTAYAGFQHVNSEFTRLASRSKELCVKERHTPGFETRNRTCFQQKQARYDALTKLAEQIPIKANTARARAIFAAGLWHPSSNEHALYQPFYGPFKQWTANADLVALIDVNVDETLFKPRGYAYDEQMRHSFKLLKDHTNLQGPCTAQPCYLKAPDMPQGLHIFVRDDLWPALYPALEAAIDSKSDEGDAGAEIN